MEEEKFVEFPVFVDDKGNRLVFPGVYVDDDKSYDWDHCMMLSLTLGLTQEKDRLRVKLVGTELVDFPHVPCDVTHPGLLHGGTMVRLIGGPTFDLCKGGGDH